MSQDARPRRQIWATATHGRIVASRIPTTQPTQSICTVALPSGGVLRFNDSYTLELAQAITFEADCLDANLFPPGGLDGASGNSTVVKFDPFYASVPPQTYALACATVISYILVILILITPRTFYMGGPTGGSGTGFRTFVPGASSNNNVIGVGRRPLLQKIAAFTVAVSLTIATADTFKVAEGQYNSGLMDSQELVDKVIGSIEIRVVRVISDTFLWLAQVQTLIRLFPRHKEKVTIKWLGFGLILCDTVFSILESFLSKAVLTRPRSFQDAIPALSYLFQMAISLIYASCVIYYALSKRRYAFWHAKMRNICLVAILSLLSVLIPVVFFVLDVSQPTIATWGEYIRWIGAAAASVVVWEWVERIETLERDEKKDGILGRQIFDGDEMVDVSKPSRKSGGSSSCLGFNKRKVVDEKSKAKQALELELSKGESVFKRQKKEQRSARTGTKKKSEREEGQSHNAIGSIEHSSQTTSPVNRSDTQSAASTVYAVRYHNVTSPSPAIPEGAAAKGCQADPSTNSNEMTAAPGGESEVINVRSRVGHDDALTKSDDDRVRRVPARKQGWHTVANPFKRKRADPPAEVAAQLPPNPARHSPAERYHNVRDRINKGTQRLQERMRLKAETTEPLPVTVIPAQPRSTRHGTTSDRSHLGSMAPLDQDRQSSTSSKTRRKRDRENLPVTVIPAPVKGGRTWSPDDLKDEDAEDRSRSAPTNSHDDTVVNAAEHASHADGQRTSTPTRAVAQPRQRPAVVSINDRLSSVSPAATGSIPDSTMTSTRIIAGSTSILATTQPVQSTNSETNSPDNALTLDASTNTTTKSNPSPRTLRDKG